MNEDLTPSEVLAATVVDRLIEAGLIRADRRDALAAKIGAGAMKSDDWSGEIEFALAKGDAQ